MARPDLHLFERDLANKPGKGSSAPPRTIRAKDLDGNFRRLTLIEPEGTPKSYTVQYTADGVRLTDIKGYPDPPESGTYVLGSVGGVVQWIETEEC